MTAPSSSAGDSTLVKRSLEALQDLRLRYQALQQSQHEPIAIVGIGCRLPGGVDSPRSLWQLLCAGQDAVTAIPSDRFTTLGGETKGALSQPIRFGGFLRDLDRFDPYFFGISPREAAKMDPQQRLFLEVAWHSLEDAGLRADELAGSDTGVFVGANSADYLQLQLAEPAGLDTYSLIGGVSCIIANRLSYLLDLQGPSMVLDTACSSSLVAVHLACQSLRTRECGLAIVGGMNLILSPSVARAHAEGLPLAKDGRCKTFDARADGYVRGEGCGVVILKRLADALASGDSIWAVVRGTAINQDGRSNGLTAPSGRAQRVVINKALANARVAPGEVGLIEAHGTGTVLGDPIEVESLRELYGAPTAEGMPCALGSIKTNIGHLEAGAGIAGLIKAALALKYGEIPANLHFQSLNPHLSLAGSRLVIPTSRQIFPGPVGKRCAAVSSFGAGGTNAHIVLAEAPSSPAVVAPETAAEVPHLLLLSARSPAALVRVVQQMIEFLANGPGAHMGFADICWSAALRRSHHPHRLAIVGRMHKEVIAQLIALDSESDLLKKICSRQASTHADASLSVTSLSAADAEGELGLRTAANLYVAGARLHFKSLPIGSRRFVRMPLYPFERESFWFKEPETNASLAATQPATQPATAPKYVKIEVDTVVSVRGLGTSRSLQDLVHGEVASLLRFDPQRLDPGQGFFQIGMDSVMAAQLRNRLEQRLDRKYPVSVIFEHPSVRSLARYLEQTLSPTPAPQKMRDLGKPSGSRDDVRVLPVAETEDIATLLSRELNETTACQRIL